MDLVGEDEMKDRAGRNQPRERSQSMKNQKKKKKKDRADEIEARGPGRRGSGRARIAVRGERIRRGFVRDIALTRLADGPRSLDPRLITSAQSEGNSFLAC